MSLSLRSPSYSLQPLLFLLSSIIDCANAPPALLVEPSLGRYYMRYNYVNLSLVPGAPPQHVYGYNISKHDIRVLWEDVPFRDVNGILLGYMVFFNESSDEVFNETVPFPRKNVTLSFLRPYTFYTIQVLAFTIKGNGPKSPPITVRTEEEGKEYGRRN